MGIPVLVVDDDPLSGGLSKELLLDAGFDAEHMTSSLQALEELKKTRRFPVVILDILMPGLDGLTMCHKIKTDPALKGVKVIMVSGKSFEAEKKRAFQYGADLFIEKPYDVATFGPQVKELAEKAGVEIANASAGPRVPAAAAGAAPMVSAAAMTVQVWGTRSASLPRAGGFGGKTPCVSVDLGDRFMIFDAGSGIESLGPEIARSGRKELWLFLTHFHPAHVEGLGRFTSLSDPDLRVHVCAAVEPDKHLQAHLEEALLTAPGGIAVPLEAQFELHELLEQTYELAPGLKLTAFYANHPGATMGFVLETKGRKLAYCPDSEIYGESARALQDYDEKLGKLVAGADLLIHDGRFTPEDYLANKNIGHSSFAAAVDCAARSKVKRLWLIHQDARYDDARLSEMEAQASRQAAGTGMEVSLARESRKLAL